MFKDLSIMEINEDNLLKAKHSVNIVDRRIRWMNERFVSEIFLDKIFRTRIMFSVEVRHWRKSGIPRLRKRHPRLVQFYREQASDALSFHRFLRSRSKKRIWKSGF